MRYGCIDIGSNTTRLLVADVAPGSPDPFTVVLARRIFLPLTGMEQGAAVALRRLRALESVVQRLAQEATDAGVSASGLGVVATQALRAMPERDQRVTLAQLAAAAGAPVELLSPEREAALAFRGATALADPRAPAVGVIDVGGGSTELIVGRPDRPPEWWCSVPIGSRVLTERFLLSDPPTAAELAAASSAAAEAFSTQRSPASVARVWTVGGGTQSLARLLDGRPAEPATLADTISTLTAAPAIEVAAAHGLDELRTRVMPAALVLLSAATACLGCGAEPGPGGVREGVIWDLASRRESANYG